MGRKKFTLLTYEKFIDGITYTPIIPKKSFNISQQIETEKNIITDVKLFNFVLEKFPEIRAGLVKLKYKNIATTMSSMPVLSSFLTKERTYEIIINNTKKIHGISFKDVPINAKIGLIAHEFSHILDYQRKSNIEIIKTGLLYILNRQNNYEKSIDYLTIKKGFGWQLWSWSDYVFNHSKASKEYLDFKRKNYFTPKEIKDIIIKNIDYEN